jgi:dTDP-glucose 4,6-dehydratase
MRLLVTGSTGFIGGNFVLDWLAQSAEPVVNADKLTYAGNLQTLDSLNVHPGHVFVQADSGDRAELDSLLATLRPRATVNFASESDVDRCYGLEDFIQTNVLGRQSLDCVPWTAQPYPAGLCQAFIIGEQFIGNNPAELTLGDMSSTCSIGLNKSPVTSI